MDEGHKAGKKTFSDGPFPPVSRQRTHSGGRALAVVPPSPVMRHSSDPQLSPPGPEEPPELPVPPSLQQRSPESAGSYCDLRPCLAGPPKPPAKSYVERLRVEEGRRDGGRQDGEGGFSSPQVETSSSFRPSRYRTQPERRSDCWDEEEEELIPPLRDVCVCVCVCSRGSFTGPGRSFLCRFESPLLPVENKPLEMSVLKRVKELLAEVDARTAAKHITTVDCTVGTPQEAAHRSTAGAASER